MNIRFINYDGNVGIELSRRNLEHLLAALDYETIIAEPYLIRECVQPDGSRPTLTVFAVENDAAYADREPGPGFERLTKDS